MWRSRSLLGFSAALLAATTQVSSAQERRAVPAAGAGPASRTLWTALTDSSRATWIRPLASAMLPGAGQLMARQDRGALYLVAEVYLAARYITQQREGEQQAGRFRDLAFEIARRGFAPIVRDTAFGYFEEMAKFVESGPYDTDPGLALVPPTDDRTFNGSIWQLARETFFQHPDSLPPVEAPEYQQALAFYRRRAVGPDFQWSWRGAGLEQDLFRQTIRASDQAFRVATQHLGVLLANHLLSMVDAFVSQRLTGNGTSPVQSELTLFREASPQLGLRVTIGARLR